MAAAGIGMEYAKMVQQQASGLLNSPRPLGFVERAAGVANGLAQLQDKIEALRDRIEGSGGNQASSKVTETAPGLGAQLDEAEGRVRVCLSILDELHARF